MKLIITEDQYNKLLEPKVLKIPSLDFFDGWDNLQKFLKIKGNPFYLIVYDLDLGNTEIKSLGNLTSVGGYLNLRNSEIKSLGNLISVGGNLYLYNTSIESLGNLTSVGGSLNLRNTPISKMYSEEEIRNMVDIKGEIYL